jgi:uncharacterized protein (DUF3820 family)
MTDETPMPFGKWKGTLMINVPGSYLLWLWDTLDEDQPRNEEILGYIRNNLTTIEAEVKRNANNKQTFRRND